MSCALDVVAECETADIESAAEREADDTERRDALIIANLEWAHGIARGLLGRLPWQFDLDDLIGPAELGLVKAATRYDPAKNNNFQTYAYPRVHGSILDSIKRREYRERSHKPIAAAGPLRSPGPSIEDAIDRQRVWKFVDQLPERRRKIIQGIYREGKTLEEIAGEEHVSVTCICRLHRESLRRLRESMAPESN
jgi:RNA polymerase sigma factor (sigma-70 family)